MTTLETKFNNAALKVKTLPVDKASDTVLSELYGLYKQALHGDNNNVQPWSIQLVETIKWNAWTKNKGMSKEVAMEKYINYVNSLILTYANEI